MASYQSPPELQLEARPLPSQSLPQSSHKPAKEGLLQRDIRGSMMKREYGKGFLQWEQLQNILTKDKVIQELERYNRDGLANISSEETWLKISGSGGALHTPEDEYYITFAVLLMLGRGHEIDQFIESQITDRLLPLDRCSQIHVRLGKWEGDGNFRSFPCFDHWKTYEKDMFLEYYWCLTSPRLAPAKSELGFMAQHYEFASPNMGLPWEHTLMHMECRGYSSVSKCDIDPRFHGFGDVLTEVVPFHSIKSLFRLAN